MARLAYLDYLSGILEGFKVTASLVVDGVGRTVNSQGNSRGIGGPMDLQLLKALRSRSELVYTSGKTARAEGEIRPRTKDFAVLSRTESFDTHGSGSGRVFFLGPQAEPGLIANSASQGLLALKLKGFKKIHCEFGIQGTLEILESGHLELLVLSCEAGDGAQELASAKDLAVSASFKIGDLTLLMVTGRG